MVTRFINSLTSTINITESTNQADIKTSPGTLKTDGSLLELFDNDENLITLTNDSGVLSTGLIDGGELTINAGDSTKFDIAAGNGIIIDAYTDPNNPTTIRVSWNAIVGVTSATPSSSTIFVFIDDQNEVATASNVVQEIAFPSGTTLRDKIQLGGFDQVGGVLVTASDFTQCPIQHIAQAMTDLQIALGVINVIGNIVSGNVSVVTRLDLSAGVAMFLGIQYKADKKNPNNRTTPARTQAFIVFSWRDGSGGFTTSKVQDLTFGVFDDDAGGGVNAPTTTCSTNQWVVQTIRRSPDLDKGTQSDSGLHMEYGQEDFATSAGAIAAVTTNTLVQVPNPALAGMPIRAHIVMRCGGSDLTDEGDAIFLIKDKFGTI